MDSNNNQGSGSGQSGYPAREQGQPPTGEGSMTRRMDDEVPGSEQQPYPYNAPPSYTPPPAPSQPSSSGSYQSPSYTPPPAPSQPSSGSTYQYTPPSNTAPQPYNQPNQYQQPTNYTPGGSYNAGSPYGQGGIPASAAIKDPNIATVIEIIAGLCGFLGVGHMLTGRLVPGLILLVSWFLGLFVIWVVFPVITCGFGFCLSPILHLAVPVASGLWLRGLLTGQPMFGQR